MNQITGRTCPHCGHFFIPSLTPTTRDGLSCPTCRRPVGLSAAPTAPPPPQQTGMTLGEAALVALGIGVAGYATYKVFQALTDIEFEGRTLPAPVRHALIEDHEYAHGDGYCPGWGRRGHYVDSADLSVDHIRPHSKGGRTSLNNSQVLCRSCNSAKSVLLTLGDRLRGR